MAKADKTITLNEKHVNIPGHLACKFQNLLASPKLFGPEWNHNIVTIQKKKKNPISLQILNLRHTVGHYLTTMAKPAHAPPEYSGQ